MVGVGLCCGAAGRDRGRLLGSSSSRDSSVCRAALGGREGYYALEAGSADETLLLDPVTK